MPDVTSDLHPGSTMKTHWFITVKNSFSIKWGQWWHTEEWKTWGVLPEKVIHSDPVIQEAW